MHPPLILKVAKVRIRSMLNVQMVVGWMVPHKLKINITDANENPSVTDMSVTVDENAPRELQLAKGSDVGIEDEDEKGDVSDHTLAIVGGDPGHMFALDGRAIKVRGRGWLNKIDEDSDEYKTPRWSLNIRRLVPRHLYPRVKSFLLV